MSNRESALQLASEVFAQIEEGDLLPDGPIILNYALILILADISEQLEKIEKFQRGIWIGDLGDWVFYLAGAIEKSAEAIDRLGVVMDIMH